MSESVRPGLCFEQCPKESGGRDVLAVSVWT
jgi:hypothetical protein